MADVLAYRKSSGGARGDRILGEPQTEQQTSLVRNTSNPLDGEEARKLHRKLMSWYYFERDRQAENRMEMATDHDFYDGDQWDPQDAAMLADRNQMALVYNEVAPLCDWLIGTERRNRVDWDVLPRSEDDVEMADTKSQVLKYVADVNRVAHNRSRAFADSIKGGEGYVDDGVRDDPTQDVLYSRYEDWRNVLMDSTGLDLTGDDARYVFRWRWVDEDVALLMFPGREDQIHSAMEDWASHWDPMDQEASWDSPLNDAGSTSRRSGSFSPLSAGSAAVDAQRRRVKLIECQYREPGKVKFVASGPLRGAVFDPRDRALVGALNVHGGTIIDKIAMRVCVAVMTEAAMLSMGPSIYRHNKFSLTRLVCYRKGRTRQSYGVIRRVRGIQQDLNKRASKALWLVNTNQLIGDRDAFDDWDQAREDAQDPQGALPHKTGAKVEIRRDTDAATGQIQLMTMAANSIQRGVNVTDENMGRKTNAVSGVAIEHRQIQGAVSTTEPFDNERLAVQSQGEKQLANAEQFYSEEKVLRLTGSAKGPIQWVKVNQPELQPDGSVRWLNDITASMADFVVSEADYAGTLRQVMFDSLMKLSERLPPEFALKLLRMAFEFSDLPNKDEIADEIRRMTGETDPSKKLTPEEQQQAAAAQQLQAEAIEIQRATAKAALEEQQAKAREINAKAEKLMAEIEQLRTGVDPNVMNSQIEAAAAQVRAQAADQIDALSQQLAKATASNEAAIMKVKSDADSSTETARIQANAQVRVAEIERASDVAMAALEKRIDDLTRMSGELQGSLDKMETKADEAAEAEPEESKEPEPPAAPAPITINVQVDAKGGEVKKSITLERDKNGKLTGATSTPTETDEE